MSHSTEGINSADDLTHSELHVKEQSHKQQMTESEKVAFTTPLLVEQGKYFTSEIYLLNNHEAFPFLCSLSSS